MSKLAIRSELDKLGWTLDLDPEALEFLDGVAPEQLRVMRAAIYELLYREDQVLFGRMAAAARRLPVTLILQIAERLGPLLTARVATEMPAARGAEVASRMSTSFAADVCVDLDPRRTRDLISNLPTSWTVDVALELARRGDFATMSRFVDFVSDDAIRGVVDAIQDEADLLRVAFYMGSKNRMDHFFRMLPRKRLEGLIVRVEDEPDELLPALLSVLIHVSYGLKRELGDIAAAQDESVLTGYVQATQRQDLWPDILPVVAAMSESCRRTLVNLPILSEPAVQERIVSAADDHVLWTIVLPLVEMMNMATRTTLAGIVAARGHATLEGAADAALMTEQWDTLLDLAALMPAVKQDELAAIVRSFGEVEPALLHRVAQGATERGFGDRFEVSDVR
ncbi:MAG TPA: hypothetical protein VG476_02230 [Acidimicrobiales bacterium]|nr:hypothetical protein [Acidimicrobiales bacterium]